MIRRALGLAAAALLAATALTGAARASDAPDPADWEAVLKAAQGQTVYWNAWGGEPRINAYIAWAGEQVKARYGVSVEHVKLSDTADAVARVVAEKTAGRDTGGSIDLIWINGENFAAMKRNGLLFGPWSEAMPNYRFVADGDLVKLDFTVPVDGLEAPWGKAQVVFMYDTAEMPAPPRTAADLLAWAQANPGRFTYPQVPNFLGSTFLKQVLYEVTPDPSVLVRPADEADYDAATAPLWSYLDALNPVLWRQGRAFPQNSAAQRTLMSDGEIAIAISFNPAEATSAILKDELPDTVRTAVFEGGTIGNASFVAIPYNATAKAGAMVLANFLMSPEAQARKQDPEVWGSFTILDVPALAEEDRARFAGLDLGIATLPPEALGTPLPEPHPSWMTRIEEDWARRYGASQ